MMHGHTNLKLTKGQYTLHNIFYVSFCLNFFHILIQYILTKIENVYKILHEILFDYEASDHVILL